MTATVNVKANILVSPKDYFREMVEEAVSVRKIKTHEEVKLYLASLLEQYLEATKLFEEEKMDGQGRKKPTTLAELYLHATNSESHQKFELLRKLGDRSLYISGFFSDSLQRKIVDVEYYADMGGTAFGILSDLSTKKDPLQAVFVTLSKRFMDYVEALTYISQKTMVSNNQSLLRLYDTYLQTGSKMAQEKLAELGIFPSAQFKKTIT